VGTGTGAGTPGAAGPPVAAPGVPAVPTTSPSLPRTGSDEAVLSALGALTVALGIGMCLVAREPRGQHVRTR
jgi:LPXTG-motif cell wall-anchored protein